MKRLFSLLFLASALAGCGPEISHREVSEVGEACDKAGLKVRITQYSITCWKEKS